MEKCDIVIVGAGFFGTCTALLLSQQGYSVTLLTEGKKPLNSCLHSLGVLWPSLNDPPTRADVAHGHEVACYLNNFCHLGIEFFLKKFVDSGAKYWKKAACLRVGMQSFEQEELQKAKNLGFNLQNTKLKEIYLEKQSAYICQNTLLFQEKMTKNLEKNNVKLINEKVVSLLEKQSECTVTCETHTLQSEIVVLANGVQISSLFPKYKSILVPMSDVLVEYECESTKKLKPLTFRASNGHLAASILSIKNKTTLKISGPRFLLPHAGVGLVLNKDNITPAILSNVKKFHEQVFLILSMHYGYKNVEQFLKEFPFVQTNYAAFVDCHPCDELPLVGEFGKLGKVLGCTGFLATGFSAGALGAKIIDDLICQEKSLDLHSRLKPRRFYKILG
jgi:hypothetical protein